FDYDAEKREGRFDIEQKQATGSEGGPVFELNTRLGWTIDGVSDSRPILIREARSSYTVEMPKAPDQVRFDPACQILARIRFNPGDPLLRRQLVEAPDVIGRILAARELGRTGKPRNIALLAEAYRREP